MSAKRPSSAQAKAAVFAALGDETRLSLLARLCDGKRYSIAELTDGTRLTRQAVTKHLVILEAANLVATVWRGREKLHYLNPVPIHEIAGRWIGKYQHAPLDALSALKSRLEEDKNE